MRTDPAEVERPEPLLDRSEPRSPQGGHGPEGRPGGRPAQQEVLANRELPDHAPPALIGRDVRDGMTSQPGADPAARGLPQSSQDQLQLLLAVSIHAGDPEQLALRDREGDRVAGGLEGEARDLKGRRRPGAGAGGRGRGARGRPQRAVILRAVSHHGGQDGGEVELGRGDAGDGSSVAQDCDAVRRAHELRDPVARHDHRPPRIAHEVAQQPEESLALARGQQGHRLVHDQDARSVMERAQDLHALLLPHGEPAHDGVRIRVEPVALAQLGELPADLSTERTVPSTPRVQAKHDVLGHRQRGRQAEALRDHPDAAAAGVSRASQADALPRQGDLARMRLVEAVEEADQGRLAGAVLADEPVDLPGEEVQVHPIVGEGGTEPHGHPAQRGEGGGARGRIHWKEIGILSVPSRSSWRERSRVPTAPRGSAGTATAFSWNEVIASRDVAA